MKDFENDDEPGVFRRHRLILIGIGLVVAGAAAYFLLNKPEAPKKRATVSMVDILPPPPPPPPPTPPPTPPPQENVPEPETEPKQEFQEETQPEAAPPPEAPPEPAAAPLGTDMEGEGGADFGLAKGGGGGIIGGTGIGSGAGSGRSKYGWYAGQVQNVVAQALQRHKKTRTAALSIKARLWVDSAGRVTRATLSGSSGDAALDRALQNEILNGLQLEQPPPEGMPMPIVMRIAARRPN